MHRNNRFQILFLFLIALAIIFSAYINKVSKTKPNDEDIRALLKNNPEIILDVLKENELDLFNIVEKGAIKKQEMAQKTGMEVAFKNPLQPAIDPNRPIRGNPEAPVTIVEYSDFQCPFCSRGAGFIEEILKKYPDKVRLLYKHLPLTNIHPHAMKAAIYFEAVANQNHQKAWEFHDIIFSDQRKIEKGEQGMRKIAETLGLDMEKLASDIQNPLIKAQVETDIKEAEKFGFNGTPSFLINGVSLRGAHPPKTFSEIIDRLLSKG